MVVESVVVAVAGTAGAWGVRTRWGVVGATLVVGSGRWVPGTRVGC